METGLMSGVWNIANGGPGDQNQMDWERSEPDLWGEEWVGWIPK